MLRLIIVLIFLWLCLRLLIRFRSKHESEADIWLRLLYPIPPIIQPLIQRAVSELGFSNSSFAVREHSPKTDAMGDVKLGAINVLRVYDRAVEISQCPFIAATAEYCEINSPEAQARVLNDLRERSSIWMNTDKDFSKVLLELAQGVENVGGTIVGLNSCRVHANEVINALLENAPRSKHKEIAANCAYQFAADTIRIQLYLEFEQLGGPGAFEAACEAEAIHARAMAYEAYEEIRTAHLGRVTMSYLDYVLNGWRFENGVAARALMLYPTPLGKFNKAFRLELKRINKT